MLLLLLLLLLELLELTGDSWDCAVSSAGTLLPKERSSACWLEMVAINDLSCWLTSWMTSSRLLTALRSSALLTFSSFTALEFTPTTMPRRGVQRALGSSMVPLGSKTCHDTLRQ